MSRTYTDSKGVTLDHAIVKALAWANIEGSMSKSELIDDYIENSHPDDLLQWATNDAGEFTLNEELELETPSSQDGE